MSATTELLLEQIKVTETDIAQAKASGSRDLVSLQERLLDLQKQLNQANDALNEGVSKVLKG